jgi:hypothetical protein
VGLSIAGTAISGTPTTTGAVNITETLAGAIGSPRVTNGVVTVAAATTAPAAFTAGQWSVADSATGGTVTVSISALPSDGGSAITAIQYQVGAGSWTNSGITSTGSFNITGLTNGTPVNIKVRAVNAVGNGPDSDTKSVTPTLAPSYDPDAQAYFDVMSPALTDTRKGLINDHVLSLKAAGVWSKLSYLRPTAQTGMANSRINLKNPTGAQLSGFNSPVFTDDRGWQGDQLSAYIGTGLIMNTDSLFSQNSATIGVYINATGSDAADGLPTLGMDTTTGTLTFLRPRDSSGNIGGRINATANDLGGPAATKLGYKAVSRNGNIIQFYGAGGVPSGSTITRASAAPQNKELLMFRLGVGYGSDRQAYMFAGAGLTDSEHLALHNSINTYLTAIGAN